MKPIYKCNTLLEQSQSTIAMFPQTDHCIKIYNLENGHSRSFSRNSFKKKVAIGVIGCLLFTTVIVLVAVFTFPKYHPTEVKQKLKNLSDLTASVMNKTMNAYCSHLPLLFTENCDQFTNRLLVRMNSPLPQLILPDQFDITDQKTRIEFLANMTTTVEKYIILVNEVIKQEHSIVCHLSTAVGIKCNSLELCSEQINDSNAVFYCGLLLTHNYLVQLEMFLRKAISDHPPPNTLIGDVPDILMKELPSIFRRWYTMTILKEAIKQIDKFRHVMKMSRS